MTPGSSSSAPDPIGRRLQADGSLPAEDALVLGQALRRLLARRADLRGASYYAIARGQAVVRLMTARGWVPVVVGTADRRDVALLLARFEAALA